MFNNIFANKRCNKNSICYHRKMQSWEFGLTMILFILLQAFPTLIGFLKKIAWQSMLMVHINKKFLISCFYLFFSCSYLYHIWLFPRLMGLSRDIEKNLVPLQDFSQRFSIGHSDACQWWYLRKPGSWKTFSQTFSIGHRNPNSLATHNFTKVALLKAYYSVQRFDIFCISETYLNSSITGDCDRLQISEYDLIRSFFIQV